VPARVDNLTDIGAVDQGLDEQFAQPDGDRDGRDGQQGAGEPAGQQTAGADDHAQRDGRLRRAREGEPQGQGVMAGKPGDDRGVDGMVEAVRHVLAGEHGAEHGDEDRAAGQQDTSPGAGGGGEQGQAGPRAFHEPPSGGSSLTLSGQVPMSTWADNERAVGLLWGVTQDLAGRNGCICH